MKRWPTVLAFLLLSVNAYAVEVSGVNVAPYPDDKLILMHFLHIKVVPAQRQGAGDAPVLETRRWDPADLRRAEAGRREPQERNVGDPVI